MDGLVQVGIDHHSAPLAVRERAALPAAGVPALLRAVVAESWAREALVLSTCNRTEAYVVSDDADAPGLLLAALRRAAPDAPREDEGVWLSRAGDLAAEHLFRVAAGLESAILGETEVQGQVKEAHRTAQEAQALGPVLDRLVTAALHAGKRARTDTALSRGAVSHGQAAAEVAKSLFGGLKHRRVLVVGAGEMARLAALALSALPGGSFVVANRSPERAARLAAELPDASPAGLDAVEAHLSEAHVAVFAGGEGALSRAACASAVAKRRDPLLLLDYGVPRCVDPAVTEIPGVFLYDLEALEALTARSLAGRREAVPAVEAILAEELAAFRAWARTRRAAPAIRSLVEWAEALRQAELDRLPDAASPETRAAVDEATRRLVERLLRRPAARVRQGVERQDPALPTPDHLKKVFGLDAAEAEGES
jgi:glutamyl-tRNA reductase